MKIDSYMSAMMSDVWKKYRNLKQQVPSDAVMSAFTNMPRHYFTPTIYDEKNGELIEQRLNYSDPDPEMLRAIYTDIPLAVMVKNGEVLSTSSQPFVMSMMLRDGFVQKGMKVLEIGTGSGYNAGVLAEITGNPSHVTTVEINSDIMEFARINMRRANLENVNTIVDDGGRGYAGNAPYDSIIITCGAPEIPMHAQVNTGGCISLPLVTRGMETLCSLRKRQDGSFEGYLSLFVRFLHFEGIYSDRSQFAKKISSLQRIVDNYGAVSDELTEEMSELIEQPDDSRETAMEKRRKRAAFNMFVAVYDEDAVLYESDAEGRESGYGIWHTEASVANSGLVLMFPREIVIWGSESVKDRFIDYFSRWKDRGEPGLERYTVEFYPRGLDFTLRDEQAVVKRKNGNTVYTIG